MTKYHRQETTVLLWSLREGRGRAAALVFEASRSTLQAIGYQVRPDKLDYSRVVVAISEVVIERGEAMLLAGFFHVGQLLYFKFVSIDVSPVES